MSRVALVTGGSRGIGRAIGQKLIEQGHTVFCPSRVDMDLLSSESIERYIATLPRVDILVNNAGINPIALTENIDTVERDKTFQTNILAPVLLSKLLLPGMKQKGFGRIVNISSIWSGVSKPGRGVYAATKAALNAWTRSVAIEFAEQNVLVNAVAPGFVETELTMQNNTEEEIKQITAGIPIKRLAKPEEIAEVVAFLVSERNTYVTGQTLFVDGGYTCI